MRARRILLVLAAIVGLGGIGHADQGGAQPVAISGVVNADAGIFIPIDRNGCRVTLFHPGHHDLHGAFEGEIFEEGTLVVNTCTGEGFYNVVALFVGTVLGSEPGAATFTAKGRLHSFNRIDQGHFTLEHGTGALTGVHAAGTFEFTLGIGGTYVGVAHFDERSE